MGSAVLCKQSLSVVKEESSLTLALELWVNSKSSVLRTKDNLIKVIAKPARLLPRSSDRTRPLKHQASNISVATEARYAANVTSRVRADRGTNLYMPTWCVVSLTRHLCV